ncbi:MAG TPA: hypothetical protein VFS93_08245 [Terrimesophilobacter sp.]|nr:hypothetical protein [Terrimesophilobacter sp.]
MTDEDYGGFAPPEPSAPKPSAAPANVYQVAPPTTPAAGRTGPRRWVIPVVIAVVVVVGGAVYGAIALAAVVADIVAKSAMSDTSSIWDPAPIVGEPGSPVAREPVDCPNDCFSPASVARFVPTPRSLEELGLPNVTAPYGYYEAASASDYYDFMADQWESGGGQPDECFFATSDAPVTTARGGPDATGQDSIYFLGTYEDDVSNWLSLNVRLFEDSRSAEAFTTDLSAMVEGCTTYSIDYGEGVYAATLRSIPDLGVPASMGVTGWIERNPVGGGGFVYVVELQRSNAVVQSTLVSDESITEAQFRRFMNWFAAQIAAVTPE